MKKSVLVPAVIMAPGFAAGRAEENVRALNDFDGGTRRIEVERQLSHLIQFGGEFDLAFDAQVGLDEDASGAVERHACIAWP